MLYVLKSKELCSRMYTDKMNLKLLFLVSYCLVHSFAVSVDSFNSTTTTTDVSVTSIQTEDATRRGYADMDDYNRNLDNHTMIFEKGLKNFIKGVVKKALPNLMKYNTGNTISTKCSGALLKYISGLTSVKVWAIRSKYKYIYVLLEI